MNQTTAVAFRNASDALVSVNASNPLPVTDAANGTAGTPSSTVTTVQGVASGTPVITTGVIANPTGSTTLPSGTPTYSSGQLVANSATAGSVTPITLTVSRVAAGSFMLRRLKLHKSGTSTTNASFRVHLFAGSATITCANGDNATFSTDSVASYLGAFDVTIDRAFTDGAAGYGLPVVGTDISVSLASGTTIKALIEARNSYTRAAAEVFTVTLDDLQN